MLFNYFITSGSVRQLADVSRTEMFEISRYFLFITDQ